MIQCGGRFFVHRKMPGFLGLYERKNPGGILVWKNDDGIGVFLLPWGNFLSGIFPVLVQKSSTQVQERYGSGHYPLFFKKKSQWNCKLFIYREISPRLFFNICNICTNDRLAFCWLFHALWYFPAESKKVTQNCNVSLAYISHVSTLWVTTASYNTLSSITMGLHAKSALRISGFLCGTAP